MRNNVRKLLSVLLVLVCAFSTFMFVQHVLDKRSGGEKYNQALQIAMGSAQTESPECTAEPLLELTAAPTLEQTAAPTPEQTAVPAPESTVVPVPEQTEAPAPESTVVSVPEQTEAPAPESTVVSVPEQTEAPTPESTAVPAPEQTAVLTPELTAVPMPDSTPEWVWEPAAVTDDPELDELAQIDLNALRKVNEDVVGWIRIPGTKVDYPIVQGEDNEFYLKHAWEGTRNNVGSIFIEHMNSAAMDDFNTLIYGHNMRDGSMFAALRKYCEQEYYNDYPYVYVKTDDGVRRYEIFSSYEAAVDSLAYGLSFQQTSTREDFIREALSNSIIETGITPKPQDRMLTLSTCTSVGYSVRWVVHARLEMVQTVK